MTNDSLAPIGVKHVCSRCDCCVFDIMNNASSFGSGRIMDRRFLEELSSMEKRIASFRMQIEERLQSQFAPLIYSP